MLTFEKKKQILEILGFFIQFLDSQLGFLMEFMTT